MTCLQLFTFTLTKVYIKFETSKCHNKNDQVTKIILPPSQNYYSSHIFSGFLKIIVHFFILSKTKKYIRGILYFSG